MTNDSAPGSTPPLPDDMTRALNALAAEALSPEVLRANARIGVAVAIFVGLIFGAVGVAGVIVGLLIAAPVAAAAAVLFGGFGVCIAVLAGRRSARLLRRLKDL